MFLSIVEHFYFRHWKGKENDYCSEFIQGLFLLCRMRKKELNEPTRKSLYPQNAFYCIPTVGANICRIKICFVISTLLI